jgi:Integrase zinc binding domain
MVQSDTLSRRPDYGAERQFDNEKKTVLPEDLFINLLDTELQERILNGKEIDLDVKNAMKTLLEKGPTNLQNNLHNWKVEEIDEKQTIFYKEKNYIPKDQKLWWDIVKMYHNHKTAGHPEELETYNRVRQHYWWPGLWMFVKNYMQGCGICQQFKINQSPSNPAYIAIEGVNTMRPFARCSMDLITDLPPVEGYDSILVMVDWGLSKGVILCPCVKMIMWEGTATLLCDNLFKRFGLPDKMISERDPRFAAHAFQELLKLLNIKSDLTTAYHPQLDGATERVNQEIEAYLSIYCTSHPEDWLHLLSTLEFTHNNWRHAERVHTPFELIQGNSLISIPITFSHTKFPSIEEKIKQMINDREEALTAYELAKTRIANRKQSNFTPFKKNQKVWLYTRNLKMNHHKKIMPQWEGPFKINEVLEPVTY